MIVALAGGVGGAKLAAGLAQVLAADALTVVVNTGDDFEHLGLHISPDLDTVMYTLAGINDSAQGWGIAGETWSFMDALEQLGGETWFKLGDRDLATHIRRTQALQAGASLSAVTQELCAALNIRHRVVPMSDQPVRTLVHTSEGVLAFQDYFVRRRAQPTVARVEYDGAERASMSDEFRSSLESRDLSAIILCPSNPYLSIAPILALPDVKAALRNRRAPVIAVSPIIAGRALKGPAAKIMREIGTEPSALEVARYYEDLIDALVVDSADVTLGPAIEALGLRCCVTPTIMKTKEERAELAVRVLEFAQAVPVTNAAGCPA